MPQKSPTFKLLVTNTKEQVSDATLPLILINKNKTYSYSQPQTELLRILSSPLITLTTLLLSNLPNLLTNLLVSALANLCLSALVILGSNLSTRQHTPPIYLSAPTPIYSPIYSSAHLPSLLNHLRHAPLNLAAFHNMLVINLLVNASLATAASPTLDPLHTPVKKLRRFSHFRSPPLPARRQPARHQPCRRRLTRRRRSLTFRRAPQDTLVIYAALAQNLCPAPLHLAALLHHLLVANLLVDVSLATAAPPPLYPITLQSKTFAPLLLILPPSTTCSLQTCLSSTYSSG